MNSPKYRFNTKRQSLFCSSFIKIKNLNVEFLLQVFKQFLWRKQNQTVGNGYRIALACSFRKVALMLCDLKWNRSRRNYDQKTVRPVLLLTRPDVFVPDQARNCCVINKKLDYGETGLIKWWFRCIDMFFFCGNTYCCYDVASKFFGFSSKNLIRRVLEPINVGPLKTCHWALHEKVLPTLTYRGFRSNNHMLIHTNKLGKYGLTFTQKEL